MYDKIESLNTHAAGQNKKKGNQVMLNNNGFDISILTQPAATLAVSRVAGTLLAPLIVPKQLEAQTAIITEAIKNGTLRQKNLLDAMTRLSDNGDLSPELKTVFATLLLQPSQVL